MTNEKEPSVASLFERIEEVFKEVQVGGHRREIKVVCPASHGVVKSSHRLLRTMRTPYDASPNGMNFIRISQLPVVSEAATKAMQDILQYLHTVGKDGVCPINSKGGVEAPSSAVTALKKAGLIKTVSYNGVWARLNPTQTTVYFINSLRGTIRVYLADGEVKTKEVDEDFLKREEERISAWDETMRMMYGKDHDDENS